MRHAVTLIKWIFNCFRFPTDAKRRDRWVFRLRRKEATSNRLWKPGNGAVICSEHFHPSDFLWQWGRKLIKKDSEPTVFSFAPATSRKPPMNRNLTQSVGHSVEQVSSIDLSASCQPELRVSVDSSKLMDDHQYCLKSPKKLSRQVSELTKKLHDKTAALRNARKRERRLHGRIEDLLKRLKK